MADFKKENKKDIDYLDDDPVIHGQEWICVSFLSPEGIKNCKMRGLKFRGAFSTREEAENHAKMIQEKLDPDFHIFVGEGFKWLPWNPEPDSVENQEYYEKELNDLMKSTKENLYLKKQHENERKKKFMEQAMENKQKLTEQQRADNIKEKLRKKHTKKQQNKMHDDEEDTEPTVNIEPVVKTEEEIKDFEKKINNEEKEIENEKKDVKELAGSVQRLQEVYNKLLSKQQKSKE
jgi:hypothetical protein